MKTYTIADLKPGISFKENVTDFKYKVVLTVDNKTVVTLPGGTKKTMWTDKLLSAINSGEYTLLPSIHPVMQETVDGIFASVKLSGDTDYQDINGPELPGDNEPDFSSLEEQGPEPIDYFESLKETDILINNHRVLYKVVNKTAFPVGVTLLKDTGTFDLIEKYEINDSFNHGTLYNITGLEEPCEPNAAHVAVSAAINDPIYSVPEKICEMRKAADLWTKLNHRIEEHNVALLEIRSICDELRKLSVFDFLHLDYETVETNPDNPQIGMLLLPGTRPIFKN